MENWVNFLELYNNNITHRQTPGNIMIRFVNRYFQPIDGIRYLIKIDGEEIKSITTISKSEILLAPKTMENINVFVWSKKNNFFKMIDSIKPKFNEHQLIYERIKTFKHSGKTYPHPINNSKEKQENFKPFPAPSFGPSPIGNQGVNKKELFNVSGVAEHVGERSIPYEITVIQLKNIFPAADKDYLQSVADELNKDLYKYKLDTIYRRSHFFAQAREESGSALKANEESLNYNVAGLAIFRYYRANPDAAKKDGRIDDPKNRKNLCSWQIRNRSRIMHTAIEAEMVMLPRVMDGAIVDGEFFN